ncbi:MAG: hypothetical protein NTW86_18645 [Candidatus Sumerlaeota bacterium]|nr:hypothetical protein [Candidatus Sumerlaeota bacterium]
MNMPVTISEYEKEARRMAQEHAALESYRIEEVWLFPDESENEIRLVEIDPTTMPHEGKLPAYRFGPFRGYPLYWVAIAVIRPDDKERLELPDGWCSWDEAKRIWSKRSRKARRTT